MVEESPNLENRESPAKKQQSKTDTKDDVSSAMGGSHGPAIRVVVPGKPDLQVWLQGIPMPLLDVLGSLTRPPSPLKKFVSFCKDVAPAVTSAAAVFLSIVAFIYTNRQKNTADALATDDRAKAADAAQKKALSELIVKFGNSLVPNDPNGAEESKLEIAAMELAAYGDQALPAVGMALGASDNGLRHGGVLVAQQMYRAKTLAHGKVSDAMISYYNSSSPYLKRGVLEWLAKMKQELSKEEGESAVHMLTQSFGAKGENCRGQDVRVAMEVTNFLPIWPLSEAKELLAGMAKNCKDKDVRDHAAEQLSSIE